MRGEPLDTFRLILYLITFTHRHTHTHTQSAKDRGTGNHSVSPKLLKEKKRQKDVFEEKKRNRREIRIALHCSMGAEIEKTTKEAKFLMMPLAP